MALFSNCKNKTTIAVFTNQTVNSNFSPTNYTALNFSDVALMNIDDFPPNSKGVLKVTWKNDTADRTNYIILFDQFANTDITASETSQTCTLANTNYTTTTTTPFVIPSNLKDFMFKVKVSAGGGIGTLVSSELQIVLA